MLLKEFGGVDGFPICLDTQATPTRSSHAVKAIAPGFGGINLEDISSPRCFEIEDRLQGRARHPGLPRRPARHRRGRDGGAVQRAQGRRQAARGPAGRDGRPRRRRYRGHADAAPGRRRARSSAATRKGAIYVGRDGLGRDAPAQALVRREHELASAARGGPADVLEGADLFIGLSGPGVVEASDLDRMNDDAMVFAMANPEPEVMPEEAAPPRADHRHRPLRLPEPDQQRAVLPRPLPRRARRRAPPRSPRR